MKHQEYKVLARKYRPQKFADLIGQESLVNILSNAILKNRIAHAYLLTGVRGVGKTTTARLIAMSLNCQKRESQNYEPCGECESCLSIRQDRNLDVIEMDAASKTGVDDIREIIDNVKYKPVNSSFKIFMIDEVHMLSKNAFNALLKTLEEPPEYLKFIFATTEIKKIPITVVSRCQRFDLARIKSTELFKFIKKIKEKENGKITDDALKLIVKISEGSVRDALSLLDRALITLDEKNEVDLKTAQKIFGNFDKSQLIDILKLILQGEEKKVIETYREIYDQGLEPKIFINDFLELVYYLKNIESLTLESTNFSLNDVEFSQIKEISKNIDVQVLILIWQFTIRTLEELDLVSNQNLSIEMFLMRLIYLSSTKSKDMNIKKNDFLEPIDKKNTDADIKTDTINQIKNVTQEKKIKPELQSDVKAEETNSINSFSQLLEICSIKKEMKLKYELEKNVNLVNFEKNKIEI